MNKNVFLCREGMCTRLANEGDKHIEINNYGICCCSCDNLKECNTKCDLINHRHLKVEDCLERVSYLELLEEMAKNEKSKIKKNKEEVKKIEQEISKLKNKIFK